jgi:hypothetical protein
VSEAILMQEIYPAATESKAFKKPTVSTLLNMLPLLIPPTTEFKKLHDNH